MKNLATIFIVILSLTVARAQQLNIDSLKYESTIVKEDTSKVKLLNYLSFLYAFSYADSSIGYGQNALDLAEKLNFETGILEAEFNLTAALTTLGNYPRALDYGFKALALAKKINRPQLILNANAQLGNCYYYLDEYNTSLRYTIEALKLAEAFHLEQFFIWADLAHEYQSMNQPDSAIVYAKKAYERIRDFNGNSPSYIFYVLGDAYTGKSNYDSALSCYRTGALLSIKNHMEVDIIENYNGIANVYRKQGNLDSATWYLKKILTQKIGKSYPIGVLKAVNMLADIYASQNKSDSALKYLKVALNIKDSLFSREKTNAIRNIAYKEQEKQKEIDAAELKYQNQLRMYSLAAGLFALLIIAGILFRNNKHKQKANFLLQQQKEKVEGTLSELKSTQAQLIQSEKMASLGELTAGIAHEIQNPLNFVNNFSEVSNELLEEMKLELEAGNKEQATEIANDVKQNLEKILHHGKRADAIVKGMLQHSRTSSGQKELTDINLLADEYLRLAYPGLRAKDKTFNAKFETDLDQTIEKVNLVPQEIGRVLLNLINNAFYAVSEKKKQNLNGYEPIVTVTTKAIKPPLGARPDDPVGRGLGVVEVRVKDNGNGIPQEVLDKIFQPFFTTKPTGQGTGLGLSLSYDIVKAHGGEIKVETKEGAGTEFVIQLPFNN